MICKKWSDRVLLTISVMALVFVVPLTAQEPNFGRAMEMTPTDLIIGQPVNWYGPGTVYASVSYTHLTLPTNREV